MRFYFINNPLSKNNGILGFKTKGIYCGNSVAKIDSQSNFLIPLDSIYISEPSSAASYNIDLFCGKNLSFVALKLIFIKI